jgi:hypothetical protein
LTDETPVLPPEDVREEAREILRAIDASRHHQTVFEDNWRKLWQLLREAKAADLPGSKHGPWSLGSHTHDGEYGFVPTLIAGRFRVPIWPPQQARFASDLLGLLNWAGVPVPDGR